MTARNLLTVSTIALCAAMRPAAAGIDLPALIADATSENRQNAASAAVTLRSLGQPGLDALFMAHAGTIEAQRAWLLGEGPAPEEAPWERLSAALDRVGLQRDNWAAGLYWHTDLGQAKQVAAATGRPILSLRLLGRLDEDRSCANSRFFRTALYANESIAWTLREKFVLHWESMRPVPTLTIEFGDGRRIERTITGNSMHMVLDEQGRPIDALPGLHGPGEFQNWLSATTQLAKALHTAREPGRAAMLLDYHVMEQDRTMVSIGSMRDGRRVVFEAARIAPTKMMVEMPVLEGMFGGRDTVALDQAAWDQLADAQKAGCRLDRNSLALMSAKLGKPGHPDPAVVESFERSLAMDTARNRLDLHHRVHGWFAAGQVGDSAALAARIYDELFLMPAADPWLGLAPAGAYAALDGGGLLEP